MKLIRFKSNLKLSVPTRQDEFMEKIKTEIVINPQPHEIEFVTQQILDFNNSRASEGHYTPLNVFLRREDEQIVGGLIGSTYWQWLHVELLWVHEAWRGKGYGDMLLKAAEQEAIRRDCQYVHLDTFSSQAPDFYQKRGYVVFGELPDFPQGCTRFFLKKELQKRDWISSRDPVPKP